MGQSTPAKNRTKGQIQVGIFILSFLAYQTVTFSKVSCYCSYLQQRYRNIAARVLGQSTPAKNRTKGQIQVGIFILSFLAYQTVTCNKVSCHCSYLQQRYRNIAARVLGQSTPAKNRTKGQIQVGIFILSFLAYQTVTFSKVSCYCTYLQQRYRNIAARVLGQSTPAKNRTKGQIQVGIFILSFLAYQTVTCNKVSCHCSYLQQGYRNIAARVLGQSTPAKNRTKGQIQVGIFILSFLAYQTVTFRKVSCHCSYLQQRYRNIAARVLGQSTPAKNRTKGQIQVGIFILSFLAYQTVTFSKVSCYCTYLQQRYRNIAARVLGQSTPAKNRTKGQIQVGIFILSFLAYQTVTFSKVSCHCSYLQQRYRNIAARVLGQSTPAKNS